MTRKQQLIFRFALIAFLLNALLPFYTTYGMPAQRSSADGQTVLICTSDGYKYVSLADLQHEKEKPSPLSHYKCVLCFLGAHGLNHLSLPDAIALETPHQTTLANHTIEIQSIAATEWKSSPYSRAPPLSLIS